jgi:methionyl aminopeptidase
MTYSVGTISKNAQKLLAVTESALYRGIEEAREGNRLHDISHAVQTCVEEAGFSVVRDFVGHGIGSSLHEEPQLPNYGEKGTGIRLKTGMTLAIEPMVNMGGSEVFIKANGWTAVTKDSSLSAHFEHTVAITDNGPEILSKI